MTLWQLWERGVAAGGDAVCTSSAGVRRSWAEVDRRVRSRAADLRAHDVVVGERLALLEDNTPEFLELAFAAVGTGAVLQPLNTRLALPELAAALEATGARWLVAGPRYAEVAREAAARAGCVEACLALEDRPAEGVGAGFEPARAAAEDPAQLYTTSGSTGRPKAVVLTHGNVAAHAESACLELGLGPGDRWGHFAPMFHLADAWAVFAITAVGGRHVFLPRFRAEAALDVLAEEGVTLTNLVPTMLGDLLAVQRERRVALPALRLVLSGGAPIARETVRAVLELLDTEYAQTYGMTETSPYLTLGLLPPHLAALPLEERLVHLAKTGRPFRGVELEVVDDRGLPVPADGATVGEIRVRGASVSPGYWRDPEATAESFRGGWLYTGDLAVRDAEGLVDIVDRRKDVILTGGETVYSIEVEGALLAHPLVLHAAVFGLPDPRWGEAVAAAVVPRPGSRCDAAELVEHCRETLAGYKAPRSVFVLSELPRTGSGKIDKRELRALGAAGRLGDPAQAAARERGA